MTRHRTVGIIGGTGWIGRAMAHRIIESDFIDPNSLVLSSRSDKGSKDELPRTRWTRNNEELTESSDIIVIAVRPDQFPSVRITAREKLVISVMAGVSSATIAGQTGARTIVRAMPNSAVAIARSYTPWFATREVSDDDKRFVQALFETCGTADEVPKNPTLSISSD